MNERIAKLYDQAIVIEDGGDYVCGELDPVKFAELIVQECAELFEVEYGQTEVSGNEVARVLKQHFGVKE